jgi:Predicted esterase
MSDIPLEYVHREPEAESESAVFVLHGRGADEQDLLPVAEQLPGDHHVISFRAPDHLQGGYTWYQLDLSGGGLENSQPHSAEFRRSLDIWPSQSTPQSPRSISTLTASVCSGSVRVPSPVFLRARSAGPVRVGRRPPRLSR